MADCCYVRAGFPFFNCRRHNGLLTAQRDVVSTVQPRVETRGRSRTA